MDTHDRRLTEIAYEIKEADRRFEPRVEALSSGARKKGTVP